MRGRNAPVVVKEIHAHLRKKYCQNDQQGGQAIRGMLLHGTNIRRGPLLHVPLKKCPTFHFLDSSKFLFL